MQNCQAQTIFAPMQPMQNVGNPRGLSRITPEKGTSNREIEELDMIIESQILYGDIWNFLNFCIDNYKVYFTLVCVEKCGIISGTQKIQPTKNGW